MTAVAFGGGSSTPPASHRLRARQATAQPSAVLHPLRTCAPSCAAKAMDGNTAGSYRACKCARIERIDWLAWPALTVGDSAELFPATYPPPGQSPHPVFPRCASTTIRLPSSLELRRVGVGPHEERQRWGRRRCKGAKGMTSGQYSCRPLDAPEPRPRSRRCADLIFVVSAYPFAVLVCHRGSRLRIGIQPVKNQCFDDPFRIGKVLCAIIFERLK